MKEWLIQLWRKRSGVLIGVGAGLIVGILMLTIGFWRTVLLALLSALGAICGYLFDKHGVDGVWQFVVKLFRGNRA